MLAASVVPAVVMMMEVAPGGLMGVKLVPPVDTAPEGVALVAKKPDGYDSVILLPAASAPPAVVVNENVAAAPVFPATRSPLAIPNDAPVTCPPIAPDAIPTDAMKSALVDIVTPDALPAVRPPMVRPVRVTVTAVLAASVVPPAVMTMEVAPGAPGTRVAPPVESVAVGVGVMAKKPDG